MQPNKTQYDRRTVKITLTCKGSGNPDPIYKWFKEENTSILARTSLYIIDDIHQNNSGIYICEAYNTIDDITYSANCSVNIGIGESIILFLKPYDSVEVLEKRKTNLIALLFVNVSY